ncbi:MAG: chromophore lyase CpcT/CpeT [Planctomycetota bacterium]
MRIACVVLAGLVLAGCSSDNVVSRTAGSVSRAITGAASDDDLARAAAWLEGSFTSAEQAESDERYFEVNLHHARIWSERDDGTWLYVEQALATNPDAPYRQRVYRVWLRPDGVIESAVYELPEPSRVVGAWRDPGSLDTLSPLSLEKRDGCAVVFAEIKSDRMVGATSEYGCASTLRGAAHATSEVTIMPDGITSWDRGFNEAGEQVWGAEAGPYEFKHFDPSMTPDRSR